jgi:hypothetical protein
VQVLAAVAPAADVDAADVADRADGTLDPCEEEALFGGKVVGQVAGLGEVLARGSSMTMTGSPAGPRPRTRQRSLVQRYSSSPAAQR